MKRRASRSTLPLRARHERGFTVLELIVALFIAVEILVAMAIAFDVHNKISRVQLQITDMQQSLRIAQWDIARITRMAGRGGLQVDLDPDAIFDPSATIPAVYGKAIEVRNNVATGSVDIDIARGMVGSPTAFPGSDILTVRGCFALPLFQIDPGAFEPDADSDGVPDSAVVVTIPSQSVAGLPQPLEDLDDELTASLADPSNTTGIAGRLLLASWASREDWGIGNITAVDSTGLPDALTLTLNLQTNSPINPQIAGAPTFPLTMAPSSACLLEEYRYYVRDVREATDPVTPLRPRLTRARMEPGTEAPYRQNTANLSIDLADQIFDLQIALGLDTDYFLGFDASLPGSFDADGDDIGDDDTIYEAATETLTENRGQDDWLYNDPADNPLDTRYVTHSYAGILGDPVKVFFVRVTTGARTFRPDGTYRAADLDTRGDGDWLEDHDFDDAAEPAAVFNDSDNRKHRRRTLSTVVEMRNI